jgi:hypothetical protein
VIFEKAGLQARQEINDFDRYAPTPDDAIARTMDPLKTELSSATL